MYILGGNKYVFFQEKMEKSEKQHYKMLFNQGLFSEFPQWLQLGALALNNFVKY